jgi:hypothetical protein
LKGWQWAREGYLLFNDLHQRVANDRLRRANCESKLMTQMRINMDNYSSGSDDDGDKDEIFPARCCGTNNRHAVGRHRTEGTP